MLNAKILISEIDGQDLEYPEERSIDQILGNHGWPMKLIETGIDVTVPRHGQYQIHRDVTLMSDATITLLENSDLVVM